VTPECADREPTGRRGDRRAGNSPAPAGGRSAPSTAITVRMIVIHCTPTPRRGRERASGSDHRSGRPPRRRAPVPTDLGITALLLRVALRRDIDDLGRALARINPGHLQPWESSARARTTPRRPAAHIGPTRTPPGHLGTSRRSARPSTICAPPGHPPRVGCARVTGKCASDVEVRGPKGLLERRVIVAPGTVRPLQGPQRSFHGDHRAHDRDPLRVDAPRRA
jgi:hypothetical protein